MRSTLSGLVLASAGFAIFVTPAAAADYQDDIREMRELVLQLQDQVTAQQEQINEQQGVMREAGLEDERGSASMMSSFLESTDFSGWVAASYFWNFNDPRNTGNSADNSTFSNPFHPDHNSFSFDEAWFVIDRAATEESPAGFHVEVVYGQTASSIVSSTAHGSGNDVWIPSANVSYMTPWGQTVTAGKFATTIGYEVAGAPSNINITRGAVYNLFQPISHVGATVSQDLDGGFTYTIGVTNGFSTEQFDTNQSKSLLWQLGWGNDMATVLFNGIYTDQIEGNGTDDYVLDLVAEMTPMDELTLWLNADYRSTKVNGQRPEGVGLAAGGRMGFAERYGIGARLEYAFFKDDGAANAADGELFTETITFDVALTDNLTWKIEQKYEEAFGGIRGGFPDGGSSNMDDEAVYLGTQLYYEF